MLIYRVFYRNHGEGYWFWAAEARPWWIPPWFFGRVYTHTTKGLDSKQEAIDECKKHAAGEESELKTNYFMFFNFLLLKIILFIFLPASIIHPILQKAGYL